MSVALKEVYEEAKKRIPTQKQRILELLKSSWTLGVTNTELVKIALNYQGRLQELYVEGYVIEMVYEGDGVYRYTLTSEPESKKEKPKRANDLFIQQVLNKLGEDVANSVMSILSENKFTVRRVNGTFAQHK